LTGDRFKGKRIFLKNPVITD
jgi:hypothetical protein